MSDESFLQRHYNRFRAAGGDHTTYVVWNDIDDDKGLCAELRRNYETRVAATREGDE